LVNEHSNIRTQLSNADPELFAAVNSGDVTTIRTLMMKRIMSGHRQVFERKQKEQSVWANPDDPENQAYIQEQVRLQNVQANMETAMEELPEGFGRVCMLYVNVEINGYPVKAFVDSGAQSTIMSAQCAERCGLMRLLDTRFAGVAQGVGTAKILGKVHMSQMKFGKGYFPVSITIIDQDGGKCMDMITFIIIYCSNIF
jgi:DNA damage-inducible protein 1